MSGGQEHFERIHPRTQNAVAELRLGAHGPRPEPHFAAHVGEEQRLQRGLAGLARPGEPHLGRGAEIDEPPGRAIGILGGAERGGRGDLEIETAFRDVQLELRDLGARQLEHERAPAELAGDASKDRRFEFVAALFREEDLVSAVGVVQHGGRFRFGNAQLP